MAPWYSPPEHNDGSKQTGAEKILQCIKDKDFWYWDGNVILLLGGTAFKLHVSRLASYCGYFRELFAPGKAADLSLAGETEGCRIYYVPPELSTGDFKHLLRTLESPLEHVSNPPSQDLAISLLFAADTLSCDLVVDLAKKRLSEICDGNALSTAAEGPGDSEDRTHPSAIRAIKVARRYSLPGVLRRAFYELLSSQAFWDVLEPQASQSVLDELRISEGDVRALLVARLKLGALWREFIMQVPEGTMHSLDQHNLFDKRWCCNFSKPMRAGAWQNFVFEKGALEVLDPLRYDFMAEWDEELQEKREWCQGCVERKRKAAEEKRSELWDRMDDLFGL